MEPEWRFTADFHTHTFHSDGTSSALENAWAAKRAGLSTVGIADHGPASIGRGVPRRDWARVLAEVIAAEKQTGVEVLFGCEANVVTLDGELDVPEDVRKAMDIVLCGLHRAVIPRDLTGLRLIAQNVARVLTKGQAEKARVDNTKALVEAVNRNDIDIITHPGLKMDIDTAELARACAKRGTALEISAGHSYMTEDFVQIAARQGVMFTIGSDAHRARDVGNLSRGARIARSAGLDARRVLNAVEVVGDGPPNYERDWQTTRDLLKSHAYQGVGEP
ncbi:MAG: PHP domain-containing protein [Bacillota bacterium]|nr:PHP domain-containing protein [Bacillota bacterium]